MKYVAFLDILGFKDLIEKNQPIELEKIYSRFLEFTLNTSLAIVQGKRQPGDAKVNATIVSDSIIVYTEDDEFDSFVAIVQAVHFILYSALYSGVPLRGAIVRGELSKLKTKVIPGVIEASDVILGKGLTDAYLLESQQNWAGCIIDNACIKHFKSLPVKDEDAATLDKLLSIGVICIYKAPLKKGRINDYYVVNWPKALNEKRWTEAHIRTAFSRYQKNCDDWDVEQKIRNTVEFYEHSWKILSNNTP